MKRRSSTDRTLLLPADRDRRRIALALYPLRRATYRIAADCERMLETLHHADRTGWRDAVGDALVGSRHLIAIAVQAGDVSDTLHTTQRISTLGARIKEPQRRIVSAMTRLLQFVPVSPEEELLLEDARGIRDAAEGLLTPKDGGRAELPRDGGGSRASDPAAYSDRPRSPARVLVADDEAALRQLLHLHLARLGCDVLEAENGRAALDIARREPLDLILTDITMPEMSGMALLKELKGARGRRRGRPAQAIASPPCPPGL